MHLKKYYFLKYIEYTIIAVHRNNIRLQILIIFCFREQLNKELHYQTTEPLWLFRVFGRKSEASKETSVLEEFLKDLCVNKVASPKQAHFFVRRNLQVFFDVARRKRRDVTNVFCFALLFFSSFPPLSVFNCLEKT